MCSREMAEVKDCISRMNAATRDGTAIDARLPLSVEASSASSPASPSRRATMTSRVDRRASGSASVSARARPRPEPESPRFVWGALSPARGREKDPVQNRPLEPTKRRRRLDTELVDERLPRPAIDLQGLGLAARPIEGEHQLSVEVLAERVRGDEPLELSDEFHVPAER